MRRTVHVPKNQYQKRNGEMVEYKVMLCDDKGVGICYVIFGICRVSLKSEDSLEMCRTISSH